MVYIYITTVVVMLALILFISLAILTISKTTAMNIKRKTMELVSLYDYLLEEHSQELKSKKRLIDQVGLQTNSEVQEKEQIVDRKNATGGITTADSLQTVENILKADYKNENVVSAYQTIRQNFSYDLAEVMGKIPNLKSQEPICAEQQLVDMLSYETIYSMSFLAENEQLNCIKEVLPSNYHFVLNAFLQKQEEFSCLDFYTYLKEKAEENSSKIKIYVSPNVNTQDIANYPVEVSDEICEGIQIEVNHRLYDFAIEKKELGQLCQR